MTITEYYLIELLTMGKITIKIPDGYELVADGENGYKLAKKEKQLPKTWSELGCVHGSFVCGQGCEILEINNAITMPSQANIFVTKEQAEASIALAQLSQLREVYRDGWKPDWNDSYNKFCIDFLKKDEMKIETWSNVNFFLSFQTKEIAQQFLDNFRDLILKAKPLMS